MAVRTDRARGFRHACGLVFILAFYFALAGCGLTQPLKVREVVEGEPVQWASNVRFYPQTEYQCGPAALASILGAAGADTDPQQLAPQVYLPDLHGSLQVELLAASRRAGRIPYVIENEPGLLLSQIEAGRPVLILQNLRTRLFPVWHYAVLVGFDASSNRVFLHSGEEENKSMRAPWFLRTWDWAGRWAMVVLNPGEIPARADPLRYAHAVAQFETIAGPIAAKPAWQAGLERWPANPTAYLALGNMSYDQGDLAAASHHYQLGLQATPQDPALSNNLASVLGEMGCARVAEQLLLTAVQKLPSDSDWQAVLATTLSELAEQDGADRPGCRSQEQVQR